ncbi:Ras family protein [Ancylostoma duodenale]|uniref:Ras family protein n=1 Tax=Ancylostoma duodenale TaxID=51022 RepID=A0A0C2GSN3_9BILA|nr:Ras family protein [Ancylostoma duodenale]
MQMYLYTNEQSAPVSTDAITFFHHIIFYSDTAGQQEYSIFPRSCSVDIDGFILVYAIDDKKSVPIVIVGNKVDLQHASRVVTKEDGAKLAQKWKAAFIETSAKDNTAVQQIFDKMLHQIELARGNISEQSGGKCCIS